MLYEIPTVPEGSAVVVIINPPASTFSEMVAVAVCGLAPESVTVNFTDAVPAEPAAGVPVIAPVEPLIARPAGNPVALNL